MGALPYPEDLSPFAPVVAATADVAAAGKTERSFSFETAAQEGIYLVIVRPAAGRGQGFHLVIASRQASSFPRPGYDDLTDILVPHVNASDKNGRLWVLDPAWFVQTMLNITLTPQFLAELAAPANRPPWAPLDPAKYEQVKLGWPVGGFHRPWVVADAVKDSDQHDDEAGPCFDLSAMRETPPEKTHA
jgi:hypothetical protein